MNPKEYSVLLVGAIYWLTIGTTIPIIVWLSDYAIVFTKNLIVAYIVIAWFAILAIRNKMRKVNITTFDPIIASSLLLWLLAAVPTLAFSLTPSHSHQQVTFNFIDCPSPKMPTDKNTLSQFANKSEIIDACRQIYISRPALNGTHKIVLDIKKSILNIRWAIITI